MLTAEAPAAQKKDKPFSAISAHSTVKAFFARI